MTVVALSLLTVSLALGVPPQTDSTAAAPRRTMRAARTAHGVVVDGALTEDVWRSAEPFVGFVQRDPDEGKAATESTTVWVSYDDGAIYVAARMYDTKPDSIVARLGRRDDYTGGDRFVFYVDPYLDRRSGFWFGVDAAGTMSDGTLFNDDWDSDSWDGVWEGKAVRDSLGWVVEMRIPYSQLRFSKATNYTWGVNFKRELTRRNEFSYYVVRPKNSSGFVSRFADLTGIEQITPPRRVEVMPYATSRAQFLPGVQSEVVPGLGGDVRLGLGSNLTLNLTVNPDFGQVDVDPAQVNLSDQEVFLNEKRPFFVEGSSTFNFGYGGQSDFWGFGWPGPEFIYTRRIGADANILGAMKLTGKAAGSWNIGGVSAVTAREHDAAIEVEPLTFYGMYRAQKEFPEGRQGLGFLSTAVVRDLHTLDLESGRNSSGLMFGADGWVFLDKNKTWVTTAWVGASRIAGTQARIGDVQRNYAHYFQQPDAENVTLDPAATSLSGVAARWTLAKQKGASFVNAAFGMISPGFDVNDLGFQGQTGVLNWHVGAGNRWNNPGKVFRSRRLMGALFSRYDWDLNTTWQGAWASYFGEFTNYWWGQVNVAYNPQTIDNRLTRGGPVTVRPPGFQLNLNAGSDGRKKVSGGTWAGTYYQRPDLYEWWAGFWVNVRPASNLTVSIEPGLSKGRTVVQYIDEFPDAQATATFGNRYVFAALDRMDLSAGIRMNWTFTPTLSFQLYAAPLVFAGEYGDFRSLRTPRTFDFDVYTEANGTAVAIPDSNAYRIYPNGPGGTSFRVDNRDGSFRALRGNAVLRWEYLPGSTLYLVWMHRRSDEDRDGTFRFRYSMDRMFAHAPENMFMLKMSYYWNP